MTAELSRIVWESLAGALTGRLARSSGPRRRPPVRQVARAPVPLSITMPRSSVRCTGHRSAISSSRARCSSSSGPIELDLPIDVVQAWARASPHSLAVARVHLRVPQADPGLLEGPSLPAGVHLQGHRGTRAEPGEQVVVRGRAQILAPHGGGLVGDQAVVPDCDVREEGALTGAGDGAVLLHELGQLRLRHGGLDVAPRPRGQDRGHVAPRRLGSLRR